MKNKFDSEDIKAFEPEAKVGLLATINSEGLPHLTLITSIQAKNENQLIWGQFSEGFSKKNVLNNPNTAFLIMTLDKSLWRGKARWTHLAKEGEDFINMNSKPMFRYNAYFGIHTVHYMDLVETTGKESLPFAYIIPALFHSFSQRITTISFNRQIILTPWAQSLFNRINSLKFLAYVGKDGFPNIIPLFQCQASDSRRLIFSPLAYNKELNCISDNSKVAVFGLTFEMESVLVRGDFKLLDHFRLLKLCAVDIDWVYNSMPPKPGQIYPVQKVKPIVNF